MESEHLQRRLLNDKDSDSNESELDTNMVIILGFVLCALLVTLALNAFARRGFLNVFKTSSPKRAVLRHIPVALYGSGPGNGCPICLDDFVDGERIRVLPKCGHGFHVGCIDMWLTSHASCPNCRISLLQPPPSADQ